MTKTVNLGCGEPESTPPPPASDAATLGRTVGVEEEFHLVDLRTRRLTPRAPELLAKLVPGPFVAELQGCVVESNSAVATTLQQLHADLCRRRAELAAAAADLGMGVAAAGMMPLSVPEELQVTQNPRFRRMLSDYQLLASEQLICGTQVHVQVADHEEAVLLAERVTTYLPVFLALSASSPFGTDGADTGYASARTLVWMRWPTTGPSAGVGTGAQYDKLVADLVSSGVISDPGMVYFDVRPSAKQDTLELRVCDSSPSVDTVTLIAGLFRAAVAHESQRLRAGLPTPQVPQPLARAALWRAARSGLEGDLVDLGQVRPRPAVEVVEQMALLLRPQLEEAGDWEVAAHLLRQCLAMGTSAARQRQVLQTRGRLADVVDLLLRETAGACGRVGAPGDS